MPMRWLCDIVWIPPFKKLASAAAALLRCCWCAALAVLLLSVGCEAHWSLTGLQHWQGALAVLVTISGCRRNRISLVGKKYCPVLFGGSLVAG